jgi:hypothetical protein
MWLLLETYLTVTYVRQRLLRQSGVARDCSSFRHFPFFVAVTDP